MIPKADTLQDFDLKMVKGNCLNYLGSNKFDIAGPRTSSSAAIPKSVKRVHEIYKKPTFLENLDAGDVKQGSIGNCWLIASLSALANVEDGIKPGATASENAGLREARKRIRLLEQENEVLRRAAAYLSQANLPGK